MLSNIRITSRKFLLRFKTIVSKLKKPNVTFHGKIKYLGHILDKDGRNLDPEPAATIKDMTAPNTIASLVSFLGRGNYYQVFIQNKHDLHAHPLNELLKKISHGTGQRDAWKNSKSKKNVDVRLISHTWQTGLQLLTIFGSKKVFLRIEPKDYRDRVQSCRLLHCPGGNIHWPDLKKAGLFRRNLFLNSLKTST